MEFGIFHEFPSLPDRSHAEAFAQSFELVDGAPTVTRSALTVRGGVGGIDAAGFAAAATAAKDGCPVSRALKGNVEITLDAALA